MSLTRLFPRSAIAAALLTLTACNSGGGVDLAPQNSNTRSASASVAGPLDPVQGALSDVLSGALAGALPAPLNGTVACLDGSITAITDVPDALLATLSQLPNGADPASAFEASSAQIVHSLQIFASRLQGGLMMLAGQSQSCTGSISGNPLAGTPLEPIGAPLEMLISQLDDFSAQSAAGQDPDLTSVTNTVAPLLVSISLASSALPAEVRQAPIFGGLIGTVGDLTQNLAVTLGDVGEYDATGTQTGITTLLDNALTNVLTEVIPVGQIDAQTGQNFSSQIQAGIDTVTTQLGGGLGQITSPVFSQVLDDALSPALDPVEGLLAQVLGQVTANAPADPLSGILGTLAGNGTPSLDPLLALFNTGAQGNPLSSLLTQLNLSSTGSPLNGLMSLSNAQTGTPLDSLLGQLLGAV